ncbi:MAG: hypothetical protein PVJ28_02695 [Acidimicrobiia bacterium]
MTTDPSQTPLFADRERLGRILFIAGVIGAGGALIAGLAGWLFAGRATSTFSEALEPISGIVVNVSETIDASLVMVERTATAIESIESATRSTARTLDSVSQVIGDTSELVAGGVADSLDSAVATLPALVDTGRVIDRTMRALSLVGVDYDPEIPLDESLTQLENSLRPIPGQLRDQVELLTEVQGDLDEITRDAGQLAAVLFETRIDLMEVESVLESAAENAAAASQSVTDLRSDVDTYATLGRVVVVAVTIALLATASAPLLVGLHYRRDGALDR